MRSQYMMAALAALTLVGCTRTEVRQAEVDVPTVVVAEADTWSEPEEVAADAETAFDVTWEPEVDVQALNAGQAQAVETAESAWASGRGDQALRTAWDVVYHAQAELLDPAVRAAAWVLIAEIHFAEVQANGGNYPERSDLYTQVYDAGSRALTLARDHGQRVRSAHLAAVAACWLERDDAARLLRRTLRLDEQAQYLSIEDRAMVEYLLNATILGAASRG